MPQTSISFSPASFSTSPASRTEPTGLEVAEPLAESMAAVEADVAAKEAVGGVFRP